MALEITRIVVNSEFWIIIVAACFASSLFGTMIITPVMGLIFRGLPTQSQDTTHTYALLVGIFERSFYTLTVCFGAYLMVGSWLVLKAFSSVNAEKRDMESFYAYLLGNILSLFIGTIFGFTAMFLILKNAYVLS